MPLDRVQLQSNISTADTPARFITDTTSSVQLGNISSVQGLTLITSNRFDNVTAVSINNCFTSLYQNYRVLLTLTNVNADSDFTLRLRSGGFDNVSPLYDNSFMGIDTSNAANNATGTSTAFLMGESDNSGVVILPAKTVRYRLALDFFSPAELENTVIVGQYAFVNKAATAAICRMGSGQHQFNSLFDGFSFISSIASSISGIVRIYGYKI